MKMNGMIVSLRLPFPVPVNALFRNASSRDGSWKQGRRRIPTQRYLTWRVVADTELTKQLAGIQKPVFSEPVRVEIELGRPDKRRRDIDGLAKALLDRMTGVVYADDSQVVDLRLRYANVDGAHISVVAA